MEKDYVVDSPSEDFATLSGDETTLTWEISDTNEDNAVYTVYIEYWLAYDGVRVATTSQRFMRINVRNLCTDGTNYLISPGPSDPWD